MCDYNDEKNDDMFDEENNGIPDGYDYGADEYDEDGSGEDEFDETEFSSGKCRLDKDEVKKFTGSRAFTTLEFLRMVHEVKNDRYDMLMEIGVRALSGYVNFYCNKPSLRNREYNGEILDDILLRLKKRTLIGFVLRQGIDKPNLNPNEFNKWIFTVAKNACRDKVKKVASDDAKKNKAEKAIIDIIPAFTDDEEKKRRDENNEKLRKTLGIALNSSSKPHIVLTWIGMLVFMAYYGVTKKTSNHRIEELFADKDLNTIYRLLKKESRRIEWLVIPADLDKKMNDKLMEENENGKTYGETKYSEFYGKADPRSAISGWEYRINQMIYKVVGNGTLD